MRSFCQDRDLLAIEPGIFLGGGPPALKPSSGTDGAINGTTFTSAAGNFTAGGVQPGMVICVHHGTPAEGSAYEILSIASATTMTLSNLRADVEGPAIAPPPGSKLSFYVCTFAPTISGVSEALAEKLRQMAEVAGVDTARFAESAQLRLATALGALSAIFVARAENSSGQDANWTKSEYYRQEFRNLQLQLRLVVDADGDGMAEQTRTLGNVMLRRT